MDTPRSLEGTVRYPLLDALLNRRSRRFGRGMRLPGGPLAYASVHPPHPLTVEQEALLAFAACGVTGYALGDLPYDGDAVPETGGGNILIHSVARTVPSGDAAHLITVFVLNDHGSWLLKRPQDVPRTDIADLVRAAHDHRFVDLYQRSRVPIADHRVDVPRQIPFTLPFNTWSGNVAGTTLFVPVAELSALAINVALAALSEELGYFFLDERNGFRPAGIASFARSKGGHLFDDPAQGRVATLGMAQEWLYEFAAIEQGAMLQNLGLMTAALGLGGFPYFAAHPSSWMAALGFRMQSLPFSRVSGLGRGMQILLTLLRRDLPVHTALGLERDGQVLIKPFCPPYYRTMEEAVLAFVHYKWAPGTGTHRDATASPWKEAARMQAQISPPSDRAIRATIAHCEYIYRRYGRFPVGNGPFRTVLAYQAHHLDDDFYHQFYQPGTDPNP